MNAGPYSNEKVQRFIEEEFIPLKSQCFWDKRTELMKKFNITWTPTFLIHDSGGTEHERFIGFNPPDDFFARLGLGKGKVFFNHFRFDQAIARFKVITERHPDAGGTPEAIYFLGVAGYWKTHDAKALRGIYDTLTAKYPQSEWTRKAQPYAQIPL
jgi:hypothetical protein